MPSQPDIAEVVITERLWRRRLRPANHGSEIRAFSALARDTAIAPQHVPRRLTQLALVLCAAQSAGISVLPPPPGEHLHWNAVSGLLSGHANVVTPRDFSPCGTALASRAAQLFHCPGRYFTYLNGLGAQIIELLVVPIDGDDRALGTMWIATHEQPEPDTNVTERQFDAGDLRIVAGLSRFAAAALQSATGGVAALR